MKVRNLFFAVLASAAVLAGCEKEQDLGAPAISVSPESLTFAQGGESKNIEVKASRDWTVTEATVPEGYVVEPMSGKASANATEVKITAPANTGNNLKDVKIEFSAGLVQAYLLVNQDGEKGEAQIETITVKEFIEKADENTEYTLEGTVKGLANTSFKGFNLVDETGEITCAFPVNFDEWFDKMSNGGVVVIRGKYSFYDKKQQHQMENGTILSFTASDPGTDPGSKPEGDGSEANPFNAAAAHAKINELAPDVESEEVYVKGKISYIGEVNIQFGNATYAISDNGETAGQLDIYRGYYFNGDKFTSEGQIQKGDEVVLFGKLINYKGNTPQMTQGSKIISINGKGADEVKNFYVDPVDIDVAAETESYTIKVTGNVSWSASVAEAEDGFVTISEGASGTGNGNIVLAITQNTSEDKARTAKITVTTTEDVKQKTFEVVLTQARKIAGGVGSVVYTLDTTGDLQGSNNSYAGSCDVNVGDITWNVNGNTKMNPWRLGGKSIENTDRTVYSKTPYAKELTKVVLTLGTANLDVNSCKLVYSVNADFSGSSEIPFEYKEGAIELMPENGNFPANCYYKFVFNLTNAGSSNKYVQFSKVEFWGQN